MMRVEQVAKLAHALEGVSLTLCASALAAGAVAPLEAGRMGDRGA